MRSCLRTALSPSSVRVPCRVSYQHRWSPAPSSTHTPATSPNPRFSEESTAATSHSSSPDGKSPSQGIPKSHDHYHTEFLDIRPAAEAAKARMSVNDAAVIEIMKKTREELLCAAERQNTRWEKMKERMGEWWQETKDHYITGSKELGYNIRESFRYGKKALQGHTLTRRERRLMTRTLADIFRVVPLAIFVIVPFMEFLLPFALKIFPNMLPSTFDCQKMNAERYAKRLQAQVELTKFLQDTLEEMSLQVQKNATSNETKVKAKELSDFVTKLRDPNATGAELSPTQVKRLLPLFSSDLGLSKLSRAQLIALCKFLETPYLPVISTEGLRIGLRMHLRRLKRDDISIEEEGIESLSDKEVIAACKMRAIRVPKDADIAHLRKELRNWITLSRKAGVSNSFLLMSRVLPLSDIQSISVEAAKDYQKEELGRIDAEVEKKEKEEEQEDLVKEVNSEYLRFSRDDNLSVLLSQPGKPLQYVYLMNDQQVERLHKDNAFLRNITNSITMLDENVAEGIRELKEDAKGMDGTVMTSAMNRLQKKILNSVATLEIQLEQEEQEIIMATIRNMVESGVEPDELKNFKERLIAELQRAEKLQENADMGMKREQALAAIRRTIEEKDEEKDRISMEVAKVLSRMEGYFQGAERPSACRVTREELDRVLSGDDGKQHAKPAEAEKTEKQDHKEEDSHHGTHLGDWRELVLTARQEAKIEKSVRGA